MQDVNERKLKQQRKLDWKQRQKLKESARKLRKLLDCKEKPKKRLRGSVLKLKKLSVKE